MTLGNAHLQATVPASLSSKSLKAPLDSDLYRRFSSRKVIRRRIRNPGTVKRIRNLVGKGVRLQTPLFKWKTDDWKDEDEDEENDEAEKFEENEEKLPQDDSRRHSCEGRKRRKTVISARKLGAGLWRFQFPELIPVGKRCGLRRREGHLGFRHDHIKDPILCGCNKEVSCTGTKGCLERLYDRGCAKNGFLCQHRPSQFLISMNEGATKWEPVTVKTSDEARQICSQMKLLGLQVSTVQVVSALETELNLARLRIKELESEHLSKKKLGLLLRKVSEEKSLWRTREHEKIRAFIDDIKAEFKQERKNRQRAEIVNSKLVNDLADANLSAKRFKQEYEKERKARKLIEEVCEELAKENEEDRVEVEELNGESMKLRDEVDEERKMFQMAEVWREERVQMKLTDARIALEEKYSQMCKLVIDLEKFLRSKSRTPDVNETREALALGKAAAAVDIHEIKEFSYEPPNPDEIFSIFEDVHLGESHRRKIEPRVEYSLASHASSPNINIINENENGSRKHHNKFVGPNDEMDDESGWETVSHLEDQDSSNSPDGSTSSVNKNPRRMYPLRSNELEENQGGETPMSEVSEVCSVQNKQLKKASSIARLWKSCPKNSESYKVISVEGLVSNRRMSNMSTVSPDQGSGKGGHSPSNVMAKWSSPNLSNGNLTRGKKGSITQSVQKDSLKAKLLEARMESQKVKLLHALNHKM